MRLLGIVAAAAVAVPCALGAQADSVRDTARVTTPVTTPLITPSTAPFAAPDTALRVAAKPPRTSHALHLIPFIGGAVTSILAHEAGHIIASYAVGAHPSFGFDHGRPVLYSGIDADINPQKQFIFSSAGLNVQTLLDEAILDVPHHQGSTFERGILAGGIGTTVFYITIGRDSHVGDVWWMARTSSLSKWGVTAIYGSIAALQVVRISFNGHYAHFFTSPTPPTSGPHGNAYGGLNIGVKFNSAE
jgi:hypothetical protein